MKPIYRTQRLNPAACCYKIHPLLIFPTTAKGKQKLILSSRIRSVFSSFSQSKCPIGFEIFE
jgi:hypothetical protein